MHERQRLRFGKRAHGVGEPLFLHEQPPAWLLHDHAGLPGLDEQHDAGNPSPERCNGGDRCAPVVTQEPATDEVARDGALVERYFLPASPLVARARRGTHNQARPRTVSPNLVSTSLVSHGRHPPRSAQPGSTASSARRRCCWARLRAVPRAQMAESI